MIMKPVGAAVHARRGTVHRSLVLWLVVGSVPTAFAGVFVLRQLGDGEQVQERIKIALGVALLVATTAILLKSRAAAATRRSPAGHRHPRARAPGADGACRRPRRNRRRDDLRRLRLVDDRHAVDALPRAFGPTSSVGTDLAQAVPLVAAASLGHLLFGDFRLGLTTSLLIGALPGVYLGARVSAQANTALIRKALVVVLLASGLKLLGAPTAYVGACRRDRDHAQRRSLGPQAHRAS